MCGSKVWAKTPWNEEIISVPAGVLDSANQPPEPPEGSSQDERSDAGRRGDPRGETGKVEAWRPHKEQFCGMRQGWVPEFGELIGSRFVKGPGGEDVGVLIRGKEGEGKL